MTSKTVVKPAATDRRSQLEKTYMFVVNNWAVSGPDVAEALGVEKPAARSLLKTLTGSGLIAAEHVNGDSALTYQSSYDIENSDVKETRKKASADFDGAFPKDSPVVKVNKTEKNGATGARYTPEQIKTGIALTVAGQSAKAVAAEVGVKSPSYFRKTVLALIVAEPAKKKPARKGRKSASASLKVTA